MTLQRIFPLTLLLAVLPFAACDDGDPGGGNGACDSGTLTATVDGQAFSSECVQFQFSNGVLSVGGITNFDGSDGATQRQINLTGSASSPGTYPALGFASYFEGASADANNAYVALSGQIVVDEASASGASGSFNFTGRNNAGQTVTVTNGSFDVTE